MNKNAFTLVELIVTITILAILWTIAFISFQWYSVSSRDSVRISDIWLIKSSLELFNVDSWKYPETTNWVEITYTWSKVWTQGIFWESTFKNVSKINKIPKDPLSEKEYTYSLINSKNEYEVAWILEWENSMVYNNIINKTNTSN